VGLKSQKSLNLTNGYPNNKNNNKKNNKVKSKPLELRSRVKNDKFVGDLGLVTRITVQICLSIGVILRVWF
jgi:hypothetical protein